MSEGIRLLRADRAQLRWDAIDPDSQLPPDHRARLVWAFLEAIERAKRRPKEEAAKSAPSVSTADPEVRQMRMPDGATHPAWNVPAWNVQVATATGFIVTIEPAARHSSTSRRRWRTGDRGWPAKRGCRCIGGASSPSTRMPR